MKEKYSGVDTKELMKFWSLSVEDRRQLKKDMVTDFFLDLYDQGLSNSLIYLKLTKVFRFPSKEYIWRFFTPGDVIKKRRT